MNRFIAISFSAFWLRPHDESEGWKNAEKFGAWRRMALTGTVALSMKQRTQVYGFLLALADKLLTQMVTSSDRPNSVQISLMRLFDRPMEAGELNTVHQLLMDYYNQSVAQEADAIMIQKGYTQADLDRVLNTTPLSSR